MKEYNLRETRPSLISLRFLVLRERTGHIGGLPANGLGVTGISTKGATSGLFWNLYTGSSITTSAGIAPSLNRWPTAMVATISSPSCPLFVEPVLGVGLQYGEQQRRAEEREFFLVFLLLAQKKTERKDRRKTAPLYTGPPPPLARAPEKKHKRKKEI